MVEIDIPLVEFASFHGQIGRSAGAWTRYGLRPKLSGSPGGAVVGFFIGAFFGSAIGIAGFGTAIAGTVPIGILGAWLGYRHRKPVRSDGVEVRKPGGALKPAKDAVILALDLLVLFLLFIKKLVRRSNQ